MRTHNFWTNNFEVNLSFWRELSIFDKFYVTKNRRNFCLLFWMVEWYIIFVLTLDIFFIFFYFFLNCARLLNVTYFQAFHWPWDHMSSFQAPPSALAPQNNPSLPQFVLPPNKTFCFVLFIFSFGTPHFF